MEVHAEDYSYSDDYYQYINYESMLSNLSCNNAKSEYIIQYDYMLLYEDNFVSYHLNRFPVISDFMAYGSAQYLGFHPYLSKINYKYTGRFDTYQYNHLNARTQFSDIIGLSFGVNSYNNSNDFIDPFAKLYIKIDMNLEDFYITGFVSSLSDHSNRYALGLEYSFSNAGLFIDLGIDNYSIELYYNNNVRYDLYYTSMGFEIDFYGFSLFLEGYYAYNFENIYYSYVDFYQYHIKSIISTKVSNNIIDMIFYYNQQDTNIGFIVGNKKRSIQLVLLRNKNTLQMSNLYLSYNIYL